MDNYFNVLESFSILSIFGVLSTVVTFVTFALFFLRAWIFYKKGVLYASKNAELPKLTDVHLVFFIIGILAPLVVNFIPILGIAVLIFAIIAFLKIIPEILSLNHLSKIKPEKMAFIGFGLGVGGFLGFLLGFYRGTSYKDEPESEKQEDIKNP